jgi:hypothetical protein
MKPNGGNQVLSLAAISMMMTATFARLASQAYHTSSKAALMTTHGRTCGHCCRQTALGSLSTTPCNWKRYFSKTGITMEEDGIDRSRFTRETEIEMPDIGDDTDCECCLHIFVNTILTYNILC